MTGVALVTGGERGLGRLIADRLAAAGYEVVSCSRHRDPSSASKHIAVDLSDSDAPRRVVDRVLAENGCPSVVVNNAGAILAYEGLPSEDPSTALKTFSVNALVPLEFCRLLAQPMTEAGGGNIINITSVYGSLACPEIVSYAASKAALLSTTRSLAVSLAGGRIRVNAISPGNYDTEMTQSAGSDYVSEVVQKTPWRRLGAPIEVADAVEFILGADFMTGHELVLDGGISLVGG
ncbi:MAG: SDR family oxidoreductase [Acidimicrobiales bacterium]|nr:SDR family oxidoreductase [Acidimicrobiales bacterium]